MEFYLPKLVFKFFKIDLEKPLTLKEIDNLFFIKDDYFKKITLEEKSLLNISILILKNAISEATRNNFDSIIFLKQFVVLENDFVLYPFYGNKNNPYLLVSSFEELSDIDFIILNSLRKRFDFYVINFKDFTDILNKEVKEN